MPQRTVAHPRQREFFADLANLDDIVLTTKNGDPCALNIHGSFELYDKHWAAAEIPRNETMLALRERRRRQTGSEPRVHFHIDWRRIRYACIRPRRLQLIHSDYEIVFCNERDLDTRVFWFYLSDSAEARSLLAKWGDDWIDLNEEYRDLPFRFEQIKPEAAYV